MHTEEPVTTPGERRNESRTTHPAFGQVQASRVSGHTTLYGSEFQHQHFIRLSIMRSVMHRELSRDWPSSRETLIEVDMSEAQWAGLLSSLNVASGALCTIRRVQNETMPLLPDPPKKSEVFYAEAKRTLEHAHEELDALRAEINALKLSEKQRSAILSRVNSAESATKGSLRFVMEQFGEHMENVVSAAKSEVDAYVVNTTARLGSAALAQQSVGGPEETTALLPAPKVG